MQKHVKSPEQFTYASVESGNRKKKLCLGGYNSSPKGVIIKHIITLNKALFK